MLCLQWFFVVLRWTFFIYAVYILTTYFPDKFAPIISKIKNNIYVKVFTFVILSLISLGPKGQGFLLANVEVLFLMDEDDEFNCDSGAEASGEAYW